MKVRKGRVCKVDWESAMHYNWPKFEYLGDICVSESKPSTTHNTKGKTGSHPHYSRCGPIWLSPQLNDDPNNDVYETCDDHVDKMRAETDGRPHMPPHTCCGGCVVLSDPPSCTKTPNEIVDETPDENPNMHRQAKINARPTCSPSLCKGSPNGTTDQLSKTLSKPQTPAEYTMMDKAHYHTCCGRYNGTRRAAGAAFLVLPQITPTPDETLPGKNVDKPEHETSMYTMPKTLPKGSTRQRWIKHGTTPRFDHLPPDKTPYNKNTDDTPPEIQMHAASPMKCCEIDHWNAHAMKSHLGYMCAKPLQNAGT
ncbi:hypothetical protein BS47DRAFT_1363254 [Hydnum rufescens UP504]|uniref:Uncharacterized protein n=1 Tax=Hydnum rufescens UP504 TaxID=1448309 RepID=A0A9P6AVN1_9AGAM|nr:hypothetical protein BS47DRAFT_1363254 [Hydnum rufescens UP504]